MPTDDLTPTVREEMKDQAEICRRNHTFHQCRDIYCRYTELLRHNAPALLQAAEERDQLAREWERLWGEICPDCGPNEAVYICDEAIKIAGEKDGLRAKLESAQIDLASAQDVANSWARESGLQETNVPTQLRGLIDSLWSHWSQENADLRAKLAAVEQANHLANDLLEQSRAEVAELKARLADLHRPTHGPCCTCQQCGEHYDDCRCGLDESIDRAEKAEAEVAELKRRFSESGKDKT